MNWKETWDSIATSNMSPEKQVGRVVNHGHLSEKSLLACTVEHIANQLSLSPNDKVLDVCCGNGLITKQLSKKCLYITGVDISPVMIQLALKQNSGENIHYVVGDAKKLPELKDAPFDKICLNYSFQYFEKYEIGHDVIAGLLNLLAPGGKLFLGEIPDHEKRWKFYRTWLSRAFLLYHTLLRKNIMGKFWKQKELDSICRELKVKGSFLEQPKNFPYAHYRFDYLIEK